MNITKSRTLLKNKNILFIDDNRDSAQYYLEGLQVNGANVTFVKNLRDALTCINEDTVPFDFILIDLDVRSAFIPPELRDEITKLESSQGQAFGQFLIKQKKDIPYRYLSVVPQVFKPTEKENRTLVWNKAKFSPKKLVEEVARILD